MTVFCMPAFYIILVTIIVGDFTAVEVYGTLVDYSIDKGIAADSAKHMITLSSVGQVVGRIVAPLVADCVPSTRRPMYSISLAVTCACLIAMPHVYSFVAVVLLSTVTGVAQGYILCLKFVLIAEFMGVERTAACSGIIGVITVPLYLVSPTLIGIFRDSGGSYDGYYRTLGVISLVAALLFAMYDACSRITAKKAKATTKKSRAQ
ncbi:monocarboxylate transporter 12-like [Rhipicephalus sanguineus]|uniref:monocarboxylate transporter 12-like n=1 Tax=Rhipicephalus sanguineus TaxID=34632 RepID=UPI0018947365|nr:monocarboxylate transporter 12-like [Rhipicephalus sanguineus]